MMRKQLNIICHRKTRDKNKFLPVLKKSLLVSFLSVLTTPVLATHLTYQETQADKEITQLYHAFEAKPVKNMSTRISTLSAQFLGRPYLLGALGEGSEGSYDQSPLYRTDAFDCETFVDTVLALALANHSDQFKRRINQIRYDKAQISFIHRNHFTCLDWNINNQRLGVLKDITRTFKNKNHQPVAQIARALIDKPAWYQHKSTRDIRINHLSAAEKLNRLDALKREGNQLLSGTSEIPYIPLTALFDHDGKPDQFLFNQIPNGAIIEIIRPNWNLSQTIGTHLNVSHLGFAIREKGVLVFRQASSTYQKVVDVPLISYLRDAQKSPTIKGINIQVVRSKTIP